MWPRKRALTPLGAIFRGIPGIGKLIGALGMRQTAVMDGGILAVMISVCFVCLGNICRSPTAAGVMQHLLAQRGLSEVVEVDSAGTAAYHVGELPDRRSAASARRRGIALPGRARQFRSEDFARFDYVLALDENNHRQLRQIAPPGEASKLHYLRDFDPASPRGSSVPDPYYGGDAGFEEVLDLCVAACEGLIAHLLAVHALKGAPQ